MSHHGLLRLCFHAPSEGLVILAKAAEFTLISNNIFMDKSINDEGNECANKTVCEEEKQVQFHIDVRW